MTMTTMSHNPMRRRDFLKTGAALAASAGVVSGVAPSWSRADEPGAARGSRISYFKNGEIHVGEVGKTDGTPLTTGHMDFKPSWSKTGDMLVCFRRTQDDPVTVKWKSLIFVIHADGTGFHPLSDGTRTNFNPTWTRDGSNTPIWNRKNDRTGGFVVMRGKVGGEPGQEVAITDESYHNWVYSSLTDGRLLVNSNHPAQGPGYYLMTPRDGREPLYERIACELAKTGILDRVSVSPSETKVCFEYQTGFAYKDPGRTLSMADFDVKSRAITNVKAIANEGGKPYWFAYPRWIEGESAIIYHASAGKGQLYVYRLADGSTTKVSTDSTGDYRYPHGAGAPC